MRSGGREIALYDLSDAVISYDEGWEMQKRLLDAHLSLHAYDDKEEGKEEGEGTSGLFALDACILLQHSNVITLGAGAAMDNLKFHHEKPPVGFDFHRCERGGEATVHLPGQLVLYPILKLDERKGEAFSRDLHVYMRNLEEIALCCAEAFGVEGGHREDGLMGAWANGAKFAQVGVRARRWVTYHGLAINVTCDLGAFSEHVVPCGIDDRPVASIKEMLQRANPEEIGEDDDRIMLREAAAIVKESFENVFNVRLKRT